MLAWILMGTANFLGLNWGLFVEGAADNQRVVESFMQVISGGIFVDKNTAKDNKPYLPIRIEVEFDDADFEPEDEDELAEIANA